MVGQNDRSAIYIASSDSREPKAFVRCWDKIEKNIYSRITNKPVPLLQPEHGFCQQDRTERGQALVSERKNGGVSRLFE